MNLLNFFFGEIYNASKLNLINSQGSWAGNANQRYVMINIFKPIPIFCKKKCV